jgi:hypothetical protein
VFAGRSERLFQQPHLPHDLRIYFAIGVPAKSYEFEGG